MKKSNLLRFVVAPIFAVAAIVFAILNSTDKSLSDLATLWLLIGLIVSLSIAIISFKVGSDLEDPASIHKKLAESSE
jgi:anaerobic C4-dicarboxylate transporter